MQGVPYSLSVKFRREEIGKILSELCTREGMYILEANTYPDIYNVSRDSIKDGNIEIDGILKEESS